MSGALLIGIGNEQRGDDAVGLLVARRAAEQRHPGLRVAEHGGDGMDLLLAWEDAASVVLVDAVVSGRQPPGSVHRFDARDRSLPAALFTATSTHALGLADAVELARAMERLPERLVVYGIEGRCFTTGSAPTPEVAAAVVPVTGMLLDEIERGEPRDA